MYSTVLHMVASYYILLCSENRLNVWTCVCTYHISQKILLIVLVTIKENASVV